MADGRDFDVVIVGAGAAAIPACRRLVAAKLHVVALEARNRLDGRASTVPISIGKPVDLGCERLHSLDINPWSEIAVTLSLTVAEMRSKRRMAMRPLHGHADDRIVLARRIEDRLFFAGEACSKDQFGTAHGGFPTAVSALERIIAVLAPAS